MVAAILLLRQRVDSVEAGIVREANALARQDRARAPHVASPLPGTFGELAAPHLEALHEAAQKVRTVGASVLPAFMLGRPFERLPDEYLVAIEETRPVAHSLLVATHAERGGPPPQLSLLSPPASRASSRDLAVVGAFAVIETWRLLERGDADDAVRVCLDGLAFGREIGLGTGIGGRWAGAQLQDDLSWACAAALDAASPDAKKEAARVLLLLRDSTPSFAESHRESNIEIALTSYADLFDPWVFDALEPAPRALARASLRGDLGGPWSRWAGRDGWADLDAAERELAESARLDAAGRDAVSAHVEARLARLTNPIAAIVVPRFPKQLAAHRGAQAFLTALALGARADAVIEETGAWPARPRDLVSFRGPKGEDPELSAEPKFRLVDESALVSVAFEEPADRRSLRNATRTFAFHPALRGEPVEAVTKPEPTRDERDPEEARERLVGDGAPDRKDLRLGEE